MVHELLGLANNRVQLKGAPNITKDLEEVSFIQDIQKRERRGSGKTEGEGSGE